VIPIKGFSRRERPVALRRKADEIEDARAGPPVKPADRL
jgi:hypothetical protein